MLPLLLDISRYQASADGSKRVDFERMVQHPDRVQGVASRASVAAYYTDPQFAYHWAETKRVGLLRMAYHVAHFGPDWRKQMEQFISLAKPEEHDRLVLDLEVAELYGRQRITDVTNAMLAWQLRELGRYPLIYSRAGWVNLYLDVKQLPAGLNWWLAHYLYALPYPDFTREKNPPPYLPNGVSRWVLHQTGERGNGQAFGAQSYYIDTDRFNGSEAELKAFFGYAQESESAAKPLFEARVLAVLGLAIRKGPATDAELVRYMSKGTLVKVYAISGDWWRLDPIQNLWSASRFGGEQLMERLGQEEYSVFLPIISNGPAAPAPEPLPDDVLAVPQMWQKDHRWGKYLIGDSQSTLAGDGCLISCLASVYSYGRRPFTPYTLMRALYAVGGLVRWDEERRAYITQGGNLVVWGKLREVVPDLRLDKWIDCLSTPAPLEEIDAALEREEPPIVWVDFYPNTAAIDMHWVVIKGKTQDKTDYWMMDPWLEEPVKFKSRYWDPKRYIYRIVTFKKR